MDVILERIYDNDFVNAQGIAEKLERSKNVMLQGEEIEDGIEMNKFREKLTETGHKMFKHGRNDTVQLMFTKQS